MQDAGSKSQLGILKNRITPGKGGSPTAVGVKAFEFNIQSWIHIQALNSSFACTWQRMCAQPHAAPPDLMTRCRVTIPYGAQHAARRFNSHICGYSLWRTSVWFSQANLGNRSWRASWIASKGICGIVYIDTPSRYIYIYIYEYSISHPLVIVRKVCNCQ